MLFMCICQGGTFSERAEIYCVGECVCARCNYIRVFKYGCVKAVFLYLSMKAALVGERAACGLHVC